MLKPIIRSWYVICCCLLIRPGVEAQSLFIQPVASTNSTGIIPIKPVPATEKEFRLLPSGDGKFQNSETRPLADARWIIKQSKDLPISAQPLGQPSTQLFLPVSVMVFTKASFNSTGMAKQVWEDMRNAADKLEYAQRDVLAKTGWNQILINTRSDVIQAFTSKLDSLILAEWGQINGVVVTKFTTSSDTKGSIALTVEGTNLVGATDIIIGREIISGVLAGPDKITATLPRGVTKGPLLVKTPNGVATAAQAFALPAVMPDKVQESDKGVVLTINGTDFVSVNDTVYVDGQSQPTTFISSHQLKATVADALITVGTHTVSVSKGEFPKSSFTVLPSAPKLSDVTVEVDDKGQFLKLTGANLLRTKTVSIMGVSAPNFAVISATTLRVMVPPGASSGGMISVSTLGGTTTITREWTMPSFWPKGFLAGSQSSCLTIYGEGFGSGSVVLLNGEQLLPTALSTTQLTVLVPTKLLAKPATYTVIVTGGGTATPDTLEVEEPRAKLAVKPAKKASK